jgi:glycosyltransferase involved in cell wall biosynthesis
MTAAPEVSVVMSVYNGAEVARASIESVLAQEGPAMELVVVDDGSTDATPAILDEIARSEARVRILRQDNAGLTRALIRGCAAARGRYLARQDAGDLFLPGKLARQVRAFEAHPDAALVSCGTQFVGPRGEVLYELASDAGDATEQLRALDVDRIRGPFGHGSVLFRRDLYERVGGYRADFYFGQDLDLWIRLAEAGRHIVLPEILFQALFTPGSISGVERDRQLACAEIILECARLRRAGESEAAALARAGAIRPRARTIGASERAAALYFVGVCLRNRADPRARQYFRDALSAYPLHFKSLVRLLTTR